MNSRDLGVTLGGIVAGLMLVSASVTMADGSLLGSTMRPSNLVREAMQNRTGAARKVSNQIDEQEAKQWANSQKPVTDSTDPRCKSLKEMSDTAKDTAEKSLASDSTALAKILAALDEVMTKYCGIQKSAQEDGISVQVNNKCDRRFREGSARYITCKGAEEQGEVY